MACDPTTPAFNLRHWAVIVTCIALIPGCDAPHDGSDRSAEQSRDSAAATASAIIIKSRFPAHSPVADPQVEAFAALADTLYRAHRSAELAQHSADALDLLQEPLAPIDRNTKRALGFACMKVYGALNLERGTDAANAFIRSVSNRWDVLWPAPDSLGTELLAVLGKGLGARGRSADAAGLYRLAVSRAQASQNWERVGAHGRALAYAYLDSGQPDSAKAVFRRMIALHSTPATCDTNLWVGSLLASTAAERDSLVSRMEQARRLLPGVRKPQVISFYYGRRGQYLAEGGRTSAGATCFKQAVLALDTVKEKTIAEAEAHAIDLHNTAYAYRNLSDMRRSADHGTKAVRLNEALMRSDDPLVARNARDRLAGTLEVMPLADSCNARYGATGSVDRQRSVLDLRSGRVPVDSAAMAKTFANLAAAFFYWDSAGVDSVIKYADLCMRWHKRVERIPALQLTAFSLAIKGRHAESLATLREACATLCANPHFSWDSLEGTTFPLAVWDIERLGTFEEVLEVLQRKDPGIRAQRLLERLSAIQSSMIDSLFMVEGADLSKLISSRELMTARLMRNAWPTANNHSSSDISDSVFAWMDDDKAMTFRRDRYLMGLADQRELRAMMNTARERREARATQGIPETDPLILRESTVIDSIEAILAGSPAREHAPSHVDMGLARDLRKRLRPGTAIISYRLTKNDVFMACLNMDRVLLDRFARDPVFNEVLATLTSGRSGIDSLPQLNDIALRSLSRLLPPAFLAQGVRELVLLPSRELSYVPMEALPLDTNGTALLDRCGVRYALSASTLLGSPDPATAEVVDVFAFAPRYEHQVSQTDDALVSRNTLIAEDQRGASGPLLHNDDEVRSIADEVMAKVFVDGHANEDEFKRSMAKGGVLHLAMHAYSSAEPARSGLVFQTVDSALAGGRGVEGSFTDDGIFHAYELINRRVNTDLVVLSACETGYGAHQSGEGVRSLARSFMLAGARNTVASLWKVDDLATKEIMVKFYEHLAEGMGKADALAEAKRWYRRTYPNEPPSKWAAFILIGDNEPVKLKKRSPVRPWMWVAGGLVVLLAGTVVWRRTRRAAA